MGVLRACEQELVFGVDSNSLPFCQEANFESSVREYRDAEEGVWGVVDDGDPAENGAEVCIVGAGKASSVAEDDVERAFPPLGSEVELGYDLGVGDGDVGAAVHDSWFFDAGTPARSQGGCEVSRLEYFDCGVEEGLGREFVSLRRECPVAIISVSVVTAPSSKSSSSAGAVGVLWLEQAVVLSLINVQVAELCEGVVLLAGCGSLAHVGGEGPWIPASIWHVHGC